jgi:MoaA/NifB/PqqE/SkfB family radical SAM enzyme|tara:strand:- start:9954 stop:11264 length:1311 start_codon:yes stop_codon:yes gene_type:complete
MSKNDKFCIMPFICNHNMSSGLIKMCCITEDPIVDDFGKSYFIGNQSIDEVWNSNFMKVVRKRMLENKHLDMCKNCYQIEDAGGSSLRQEYNEQLLEKFNDFVEEAKDNDGKIKTFPPYVELRTGNKCNSACRMCNTNDSSLIYKENLHIRHTLKDKGFDAETVQHGYNGIGNPEKIIFGPANVQMWSRVLNLDAHFDEVIENIKHIKHLTISGGEPFLLEKTPILLEEIANKNPEMDLSINTNGSILTDKIVSALKRIKSVRLCVSIDGYGLVQEYIRHPLKWDKIEKNLKKLYELKSSNFFLTFNITVQSFNIFNLDVLLKKLIHNYPQCHVNLSTLTNPDYLCIQNLPDAAKQSASDNNIKFCNYLKTLHFEDKYQELHKQTMIDQLTAINSFMIAKAYDEELFKRLLANVKIYDHYRKQKLEDFIPDLARHL